MDALVAVAELVRIWLGGGAWADMQAAHGLQTLLVLAAWLVPSTIIGLGIGMTDWHETPLGAWMGARPPREDEEWSERARDLDKDGLPDF
jgi:hypothetical protein